MVNLNVVRGGWTGCTNVVQIGLLSTAHSSMVLLCTAGQATAPAAVSKRPRGEERRAPAHTGQLFN